MRKTRGSRRTMCTATGIWILLLGCSIPPATLGDPGKAVQGPTLPGPALYRIEISPGPLPSLPLEQAMGEADRVVGEFLRALFGEAAPAPGSVEEAAALYPETVGMDHAPLVIVRIDGEEISRLFSWGYHLEVILQVHDLRPWVDRRRTGYWDPLQDRIPPMHFEDSSTGWAARSFLRRRSDAGHLFGEALLSALRPVGEGMRGSKWLGDFYRLPGKRDPIKHGPALGDNGEGGGD